MDSQDPLCTGKVHYNPETIAMDVLMLVAFRPAERGPSPDLPTDKCSEACVVK